MARYIEIDNLEVADYVTVWDCNCSEYGKQTVMAVDDLQYLPTSDVQEVKRGEWETDEFGHRCNQCKEYLTDDQYIYGEKSYCPNCGADMRERIEEE